MAPPRIEDKGNRKRKHVPDNENSSDSEEHEEYSDEEGGMRIDDIYIPPPPRNACTSDLSGPRLIITRIVNENFKSYAGVQVLGPFHKVGIALQTDLGRIYAIYFSVSMQSLVQTVAERVTLLIQCCLYLDIVPLKYDLKRFQCYSIIQNITGIFSRARYQCILRKL